MNDNEKVNLRTDYLKTWIKTILAVIAGEVAVLNTFYKDDANLWVLYLSMLSFMFAIIFCLGSYEALVNGATDVPEVRMKILKLCVNISPKTEVSSWLLAVAGALFIALGVILAGLFLIIART